MKKFLSTFITLFLFLLTSPKIDALEPFIQSSSNPIIIRSQYENWNETGSMQGSTLFENGIYKMWYTSVGTGLKVAYATSSDGLNWNGEKLFNFINDQDFHDPSLLKTNKYQLFFATTPPGEKTKIMTVESQDGINFDMATLNQVFDSINEWEQNGISSPTLYYENNTIYLFYTALNTKWAIGLASSTNGFSFEKCNSNPLLDGDVVPKSLLKYSNAYYLFFHSPNGIEYVETDHLGCDSQWKNRTVVSSNGFFPYVIRKGNDLLMYYGTITPNGWRINLATSHNEPEKTPLILVPGMFASWNKEALFYNQSVSPSEWKLNPIVTEYTGIEKTLQKLGYEKERDYFIYAYDWRKNIESSADDLNSYVDGLNLSVKPNIVGHSQGGVLERIYAQKYGTDKINKLITIGSPHQGTAQVYKAVEAGELDKYDSLMWLSQELVLQLNKDGIKTDKQIISEKMPVAQNLLPTYDFLKSSGQSLSISSMKIKNNLLPNYQADFGSIFNKLQTIAGEKGNTVLGYEVGKRTVLDELLDYYPDGRPVQNMNGQGDYVITGFSAKAGDNPITLTKDHGELVYSKEGISKILDALGIQYEESQITEGKGTTVFPSLLFLMLSPAQLTVIKENHTYNEQDGAVFIENAQSGEYTLQARGLKKGRYTILIGQLTKEGKMWNRIEGEVTKDPPDSQTDIYTISFNPGYLQYPLNSPDIMFNELILYLQDINKTLMNKDITKTINNLGKAKGYYAKNNKGKLKSALLASHQQLFSAYTKAGFQDKNKILYAVEKLEHLYDISLNSYTSGVITHLLKRNHLDYEKLFVLAQKYLLILKKRGENTQKNTLLLIEAENKLKQSKEDINQKKYNYAEILLRSAFEILKEVRKV